MFMVIAYNMTAKCAEIRSTETTRFFHIYFTMFRLKVCHSALWKNGAIVTR